MTLPRGPRGFPDSLTIHRSRSSTSWPIFAAAAFSAGMPCGSGLPIRPTERPSMVAQSSRKPSSPAFRRLELAFVTGTGARSICLAPTICRSSSNSLGRTGWPRPLRGPRPARRAVRPADPAISARRPRRHVVAGEQMFAIRKLVDRRRCAIDKAIAHADISACSWASNPHRHVAKVADWLDRKNVFEARGRVRRRQRHNRADSH